MDSTDSEDATEMRSLELADVGEVLHPDNFPVTTDELIEEYGEREVEYPKGSETLRSILETSGKQTYETPDEIELAILNGVGREAVGRPRYSDRGGEESRESEFESNDQSL